MLTLRQAAIIIAAAIVLPSCSGGPSGPAPQPAAEGVRLAPTGWHQLAGWSEDSLAAAVPAFVKSCEAAARNADGAPLDAAAAAADFGRVADWRPLCRQAAQLPAGDDAAARRFFEENFRPMQIASNGASDGLVTGYWEVELDGAQTRQGAYRTPVYRRPADLVADRPYLDRAAIEDGALAGRGLELVWLQSPDDLFVLQTQGSGRIRLRDGRTMRVVYDASNNRAPVDVNRLLMETGAIPRAQFSDRTVRAWMHDHPAAAAELRRKDPRYVFFRELTGEGPVGYQGAVLTPGRSLAVDHRYVPLGAPVWLEAHDKFRPVALSRLVVAQDIGDGISGPLRGDFYWGSGKTAAARGADFYADGRYWLLLPKSVASRMVAALN